MKHTKAELLDVVYRHYPRGIAVDDAGYKETAEHRRLVAARKKAAAEDGPWRAMLRRLEARFPADEVLNDSLGLSLGSADAAYSCRVFPAALPGSVTLGFLVSFLVPYYVVYRSVTVEEVARETTAGGAVRMVFSGDTCQMLPGDPSSVEPGGVEPRTRTRRIVDLDLSPAEQPYSDWILREIGEVWGYERMSPDMGTIIVPDVATNLRAFGEATLFDCLFADDWLLSSP